MNRQCMDCGRIYPGVECYKDECPDCEGETVARGPFYVNTYLVDKAYGGPEEGGWYYHCGLPEDSRSCDSEVEAKQVAAKMQKKCDEWNKGRRPIDSVASEGKYQVSIEDHFARTWPELRPHYE